jgi:hypothetical protein
MEAANGGGQWRRPMEGHSIQISPQKLMTVEYGP